MTLYQTGEETADLLLSVLAVFIVACGVISLFPWRKLRRAAWVTHAPLLAFPAYAALEYLMPARFDIRVDLLIIWPVLLLIALVWAGKLLVRIVTTRS